MKKNSSEQPVQSFFGLPMRWDRQNIFKNFWNKEDDRLFPPKHFGIGWNVNFYALLKTAGIVQPAAETEMAKKPAKKSQAKKTHSRSKNRSNRRD